MIISGQNFREPRLNKKASMLKRYPRTIILGLLLSMSAWFEVVLANDTREYYYRTDKDTGITICINPDTAAIYPRNGQSGANDYTNADRALLLWFVEVHSNMDLDPTQDKIPGSILVSFIVTPDGNVIDFKLLDNVYTKDIDYSSYMEKFAKTATDKRLKKWIPAKAGGKNVYTRIKSLIHIKPQF